MVAIKQKYDEAIAVMQNEAQIYLNLLKKQLSACERLDEDLEQIKMIDLTERTISIKRDSMGNNYFETFDERLFYECSLHKLLLSKKYEDFQKIMKQRRRRAEKEVQVSVQKPDLTM